MSKLKQEILTLIEDGSFISGQKIARELNVSRTAVWKSIQSLKQEGYEIESVTNKGYQLARKPSVLSPTKLSSLVARSGLFEGMKYLTSTESTQKDAFRILEENDNAYLVIAEEQTKGKGRFDRQFESPKKGGLYVSVILRPSISISEIIRFNLFISLAISNTLDEAFGLKSGIKWPNDIYIDNKKVCGFLTEVVSESNIINAIICGVGINLFKNDRLSKIESATSVEEEMPEGQSLDTDIFLEYFFHNIEKYYVKFLNEPFSSIRNEWMRKSIIFNREISISEMNNHYKATALDITEDGFLEVLDNEGNIKKVISADIEL